MSKLEEKLKSNNWRCNSGKHELELQDAYLHYGNLVCRHCRDEAKVSPAARAAEFDEMFNLVSSLYATVQAQQLQISELVAYTNWLKLERGLR